MGRRTEDQLKEKPRAPATNASIINNPNTRRSQARRDTTSKRMGPVHHVGDLQGPKSKGKGEEEETAGYLCRCGTHLSTHYSARH
jgi:hypothetical protein